MRKRKGEYSRYTVLDGNISGNEGAKTELFSTFYMAGTNPPATPDIVIARDEVPLVVIDVKYKPPKAIPDRSEINQVMCYGARYGCKNVIIVYPQASNDKQHCCLLGEIGSTKIYRANLDLNSPDLDGEEWRFAQSIFEGL